MSELKLGEMFFMLYTWNEYILPLIITEFVIEVFV